MTPWTQNTDDRHAHTRMAHGTRSRGLPARGASDLSSMGAPRHRSCSPVVWFSSLHLAVSAFRVGW